MLKSLFIEIACESQNDFGYIFYHWTTWIKKIYVLVQFYTMKVEP